MFLLDSNIYIAGFNDPEFGEAFRAFHQKNLPHLILSAGSRALRKPAVRPLLQSGRGVDPPLVQGTEF